MGALYPKLNHVSTATALADLAAICQPEHNLAIWSRELPTEISAWVDALPLRALPNTRFVLAANNTAADDKAQLKAALATYDWLESPPGAWLLADLGQLVAYFRALTNYQELAVRLEAITGDGCKKFHVDNVGLRLLSAYRGAGTEWLPDAAVNRAALGCCPNHEICRDLSAIRQLARGEVGIFKGAAYGPKQVGGIVHRSPPGASPDDPRLLLCLDKPYT